MSDVPAGATKAHLEENQPEVTVEKVWPRRLLDTCTMTSHVVQSGNVYGGIQAPGYSILSYTWGRFEDRNAGRDTERLGVAGVTWQIPAIDKHYFTVASFQRAIDRIREISGNRFLWLDIACIDQENETEKMKEIGRQTGIFANADQAFIWLWTIPAIELQSGMESFRNLDFHLRPICMSESISPLLKHDDAFVALSEFGKAVQTIFDDYWFSSLWTLQEEGLRQEAVLLSREAEPVDDPLKIEELKSELDDAGEEYLEKEVPASWNRVTILDFKSDLSQLFLFLQDSDVLEFLQEQQLEDLGKRISDRIYDARVHAGPATNPNIFFGRACSRKVSRDVDRIYGIMGLYNIRVGAAVEGAQGGAKNYTLDQLQEEFSVTLNSQSPLLGQLFIHTSKPKDGESWRITQDVRVPLAFAEWNHAYFTYDDCRIIVSPGAEAWIEGRLSPFESVRAFWEARSQPNEEYALILKIDDYVCHSYPSIIREDQQSDLYHVPTGETDEIVRGLTEAFDISRLSVIHLGGTSTKSNYWTENPSTILYVIGLLVLHDEDNRGQCQRLGLCQWYGKAHPKFPPDIPEVFYEHYRGVLK